MINNDIDIKFSTKKLPFEYKLLEYRLIVNKKLYDDGVIDLRIYNEMESFIISRLNKIKSECLFIK